MASKQIGQKLTPETPFSLGIKLKFVGQSIKTAERVRLEHREDGHNKFYEIVLIKPGEKNAHGYKNAHNHYVVEITYGKMHTQGSTQRHPWAEEQSARKFFHKKLGEKIKKGYKRVS